MKIPIAIIYEAYLEAIKDGALAEAEILDREMDDLADEARQNVLGGIG